VNASPSVPRCVAAELNLRPFKKLLSVMGLLRAEDAELAPILRRMPRGLESLCLSAEGAQEAREFDAGRLHLHMQRAAVLCCAVLCCAVPAE
jgi:hypothetical protein